MKIELTDQLMNQQTDKQTLAYRGAWTHLKRTVNHSK